MAKILVCTLGGKRMFGPFSQADVRGGERGYVVSLAISKSGRVKYVCKCDEGYRSVLYIGVRERAESVE